MNRLTNRVLAYQLFTHSKATYVNGSGYETRPGGGQTLIITSSKVIERLQRHPGKSGGHVFWCLQVCYRMFPICNRLFTELGTPKNMVVALPGMTLELLYTTICTSAMLVEISE